MELRLRLHELHVAFPQSLDTVRQAVSAALAVPTTFFTTTHELACSTTRLALLVFPAFPTKRDTTVSALGSCTAQLGTLPYFVKWNLD